MGEKVIEEEAAVAIIPEEFHEEPEAPEPGPSWSTSSYPSLESPGRLWDEIQHDALDEEFSLGLALEDDEVLAMDDVLAVSFLAYPKIHDQASKLGSEANGGNSVLAKRELIPSACRITLGGFENYFPSCA